MDKKINQIINHLKNLYKNPKCGLVFDSAFELLIATILSAQCTDKKVNQVTKVLFSKYKTSEDFVKIDKTNLEQIIRSTGFYRNKAKNIKLMSEIIFREYGSKLPKKMDLLIKLPGVGRKTANVVLGNAFGIISGIVVDTHVKRISQRLGLTKNNDPEKIENDLQKIIPKNEWINFSHRLIQFGRDVCDARKPKCNECIINKICEFQGIGIYTASTK